MEKRLLQKENLSELDLQEVEVAVQPAVDMFHCRPQDVSSLYDMLLRLEHLRNGEIR